VITGPNTGSLVTPIISSRPGAFESGGRQFRAPVG